MTRISIPEEYQGDPAGYAFATMSPEISKALVGLSTAVYKHALVSLREFEVARARVAQINGCTVCQAFRGASDIRTYLDGMGHDSSKSVAARGDPEPDEAMYANLKDWRTSSVYSERERLAIDLAERFSLDPQGSDHDEDFWKRLKAAYSDAEIFDLTMSIGSWVAGGRVMHMLQFDSVCGVTVGPPKAVSAAAIAAE